MNQDLRNRRAIDLDELERQLRLSAEPMERVSTSDPLAELARLVGQEDPFKDVFARPAPQAPAVPESRAGQEQIDLLNQFNAPSRPEMRPAHGFDAPSQPQQPDFNAYHHEAPPADDFYDQAHAAEPIYAAPPAPKKAGGFRKRNLVLALGMVGVAGLGIFAAFGMRSHSLMPKSNDIPVISAKNAPVKERPENPGGAEVPNQNKQIYESGATTGSAGSAKVVNSIEQPVDLSTAPRAAVPRVVLPGPATLPGGGAAPGADASPSATATLPGVSGGEPKRVRSVAIKAGDSLDNAPQQVQTAPSPAPGPSIASLIAPTPTMSDAPTPSSVPLPSQRPRAAVATPEQTGASPVSAQPKPTPSTPAPKPAPKIAKKVPAVVETPAPAEADPDAPLALSPPKVRPGLRTASAEPKAARSTGTGGWTVQLASRPSQADASGAAAQLAQRFSGQLGGARPGVVHGDAAGKSVYRVRVGSYDKDRATELCGQIKSAGGSCFITKN